MSRYSRSLVVMIALLLVLSSCRPASTPVSAPTTAPTSEASAIPTAVVLPSPTPEPGKVLLVSAGGDPTLESILNEAARSSGLSFEMRPEAAAGEVNASYRVVVFTAPPPNLDQFLAASGQTQFVVISAVDVPQEAANLSVIEVRSDIQAFLAGYIGEVVSADWRVGGLLPDDPAQIDAFANGGKYWCGRCVPQYPPVALFPLYAGLPAGSEPGAWTAAVDQLQQKVLDVVYVSPEASSPEVLGYLAALQLRIVGSQPPLPEVAGQWVASVQVNPGESLRGLLPDVLAGKGGQRVTASLAVTDVNPLHLSEGRMRLVEETRQLLEQGLIAAQSVPLQ